VTGIGKVQDPAISLLQAGLQQLERGCAAPSDFLSQIVFMVIDFRKQ
jgi:hypothetical protein